MKSLYCVIFLFFCSCGTSHILVNEKPIEIDWIVGVWKQGNKEVFEKWTKVNSNEFRGVSYNMEKGYATIEEQMRIVSKKKGEWYFEAILEANNNVPVRFKWIPDPVVQLKFVNEQHDFPNIISYKKEAYDIMNARISNMDGTKSMVFDFTRFVDQ